MKNTRLLKIFIALALIVSFIFPLSNIEVSAASPQIGTIDITSGKLNVRNAPSKNAKVIGTLKRSDKVKSYGQSKTGWTTIQYGKGKGYISSDHVRFYTTTSLGSAKKVTDRVLGIERDMWKKTFTKAQFYQIMSPAFTKEYIDLYFKNETWQVGKDKYGKPLYEIIPTEIKGQSIEEFDWYLEYETEKPAVTFYIKNGVEYLTVSQFHYYDHDSDLSRTTYLHLIKQPKSNWKAYKIERIFPNM